VIAVGALAYDPECDRLYKHGRAISISPGPLRLLVLLMKNPERSFRVDELVAMLRGEEAAPCHRARATVRSQVRRIRLAIEDDTGPWLVRDGRWRGYGLWMSPPFTRASLIPSTRREIRQGCPSMIPS
jgi:DNA-binding response OmpR family regulator